MLVLNSKSNFLNDTRHEYSQVLMVGWLLCFTAYQPELSHFDKRFE